MSNFIKITIVMIKKIEIDKITFIFFDILDHYIIKKKSLKILIIYFFCELIGIHFDFSYTS